MSSYIIIAVTWLHIHPDHMVLLEQSHPKHMAKNYVVGVYQRNMEYN